MVEQERKCTNLFFAQSAPHLRPNLELCLLPLQLNVHLTLSGETWNMSTARNMIMIIMIHV